ncbi:MAG: ATP-grasp domain-containing protein [bacterium]
MNALLTNGENRSTLAVTRSLGRKGIKVTIGASKPRSISSLSKYCTKSFLYPSAEENPCQFIDEILRILKSENCEFLLPMSDLTTILVSQARDKLGQYTRIPIPCYTSIEMAMDKSGLLNIAREEGVPIPKSWFIQELDELKALSEKLQYPVVIKPKSSWYWTGKRWVHGLVEYAGSKDELISKYMKAHTQIPFPIVQEYIAGEGQAVFALFNKSELKAAFSHRRIRELPPSGGVSTLSESIPLDPKMKGYAFRLLKRLNWHGVAMVEFKLDRRDNLPKLMEVNPRFWGSLQLAIDSGVDFPFLLYQMAQNGDVAPVFEYQMGIKSCWLRGDIEHLLLVLLKPSPSFPKRFSTLIDFLKPERNMRHEIISIDDPMPGVSESLHFFLWLIKRVFGIK